MHNQSKLRVIESKKPDRFGMYSKMFMRSLLKGSESGALDYKKLSYCGVRLANLSIAQKALTKDVAESRFRFFRMIIDFISKLTPAELITVFPVIKAYDGERWECKDYTYVMGVLKSHGVNRVIGDNVDSILMDYLNPHINVFMTSLLCLVDQIRYFEGRKGLIEEFFGDSVRKYSKFTDYDGKEKMYCEQTDEVVVVAPVRKSAKHLRVLEGCKAKCKQ